VTSTYLVLSDLTLSAVQAEATGAHAKHGDHSMLGPSQTDDRRLAILTEEVGEVARELNDAAIGDRPIDRDKLVKELIQVAAMAATWVEALEGTPPRLRSQQAAEGITGIGWDNLGHGTEAWALNQIRMAQQGLRDAGELAGLPPMPRIVCLCGSTRFYDTFQQVNYERTMAGEIVLSVGFYPHAKAEHGHGEGVGHDSSEKVTLDELHKRKIDLADYVLVLNVGGYIGESTRSEIAYAEQAGRPVEYLEGGTR